MYETIQLIKKTCSDIFCHKLFFNYSFSLIFYTYIYWIINLSINLILLLYVTERKITELT